MNRRLLTAAATVAAALAAPAAADAAPCFKTLAGADGTSWDIQQDGSLAGTVNLEGGTNFDAGHGRLTLNGVAYPEIDTSTCTTTATSIRFPARDIGNLFVSREVSVVDGRIRWVDTFVNPFAQENGADVRFALKVKASQRSIASSSGNTTVTSDDVWSIHENDGSSHPFLLWREANAPYQAAVLSEDANKNVWEPKVGQMPDAVLHWDGVQVGPGKTSRLVTVAGTSGTVEGAKAFVTDAATPLEGLTKEQAATVINFGPDADADGVAVAKDDCPGEAGNQPNGCFVAPPAPPAPEDPADVDPGNSNDVSGDGGLGTTPPPVVTPPVVTPPAGAPSGGTPATPPAGAPRDVRAPAFTLRLKPKSKRQLLLSSGLAPRVDCDEACSVVVQVTVRRNRSRKPTTILTTKPTSRSDAARTIGVKLGARSLRGLAQPRVTVVVTATDAAGNRRSTTRVVKLTR